MFGKGGGALGAWIKELCQLIFIQTIQAFIYAIIITVIMNLYQNAEELAASGASGSDYAAGLGLFSIIALVSVFKVEDIARKLFGFGPTKADHGSAVKSIAKTAFALKLGSRVLDNGKKIVGGAKATFSANKDAKKAASRLDRRKQALLRDSGMDNESGSPATSGVSMDAGLNADNNVYDRKIDSQKRNEKLKLFADAQRARKLAQNETDPNKRNALIAQAKDKLMQAKSIDDTLSSTVSNSANASSNSTKNSSKPSNYHQAMLKLEEQYEEELSKAKKNRKEGFRTMTKGIMETGGAVIGATAGGILGFADGNLDEGLQGMVSGAGTGDAVGAGASNLVFGATDLVQGAYKSTKGAIDDYSKAIKEQYETERASAISQLKDMNKDAGAAVSRINKNAEKARSDLENEVKLSAGQTAKAIAKAAGKGSAKAYRSRHGGIKQLDAGLKDLQKHISNNTKDIKLDNNVESID